MKKLIFIVIALFVLVAGNITKVEGKSELSLSSLATLVSSLSTKLDQLTARVVTLENKTIPAPVYYTKDFGSFTANKGVAMTVTYGCENGDVAISGGLFNYQGVISNWRTIRSYPEDSQYNNSVWTTTVINEVEDGGFNLRVKCLKAN